MEYVPSALLHLMTRIQTGGPMTEKNIQQPALLPFQFNKANIDACSLVLSAKNINHRVIKVGVNIYHIEVAERNLLKAEYEISNYEAENKFWPKRPKPSDGFVPAFRAQALLIVGMLALFFGFTGNWSENSIWFQAGSANSQAILEGGEYYRIITALTLHADIVHLMGNCFLGAILLHYYFHLVGNGIGAAALLASSALANYLNALLHGPGHNSIGFSTAVFATVGLLAVQNFNRHRFSRPLELLMPFMAGAGLLAMLGASGERTDLGAHFFGLFAGLAVGINMMMLNVERFKHNVQLQIILSSGGLFLVINTWMSALS